MQVEADRLVKGVNLLIATPGRLLDHMQVAIPPTPLRLTSAKVWEGYGKMGKGPKGPKSHDTAPPAAQPAAQPAAHSCSVPAALHFCRTPRVSSSTTFSA